MSNLMIQIHSPSHLVAVIQGLAVGSFEKRYGAMKTADVVNIFAFVTQDLTPEQLVVGINTMLSKGFCPDAALFRRWCLGLASFSHDDAISDSYRGKSGALGNILKWIAHPKNTVITIAEKQAYDDTYHLWQDIKSEHDKWRAENAFKDEYELIVNRFVKDGITCQVDTPPPAIEDKPNDEHWPVPKDRQDEIFAMLGKITGRLV